MYKNAVKRRNNSDDIIASQFKFAKKQEGPTKSFGTKVCQYCKAEYHRKAYMSDEQWKESKYCSAVCAGKGMWKEKPAAKKDQIISKDYTTWPDKKCEYCGETIPKKGSGYYSAYKRRKYCNMTCKGKKQGGNIKQEESKENPVVELRTPVSNWHQIERGLRLTNTKPETIEKLKTVYEMGFKDGQGKY